MPLLLHLAILAFLFGTNALASDETSLAKESCLVPFHLINNEDFPKIEIDQITSARELPSKGYPGIRHSFLGTGSYKGQKVFVKYPNSGQSVNLRQERYIKLLSDHGVGPKFMGIIDEGPRKRGIVTEFIDGYHLDPSIQDIPLEINLSRQTYEDIVRIKEKLIELQLVGGHDAQIRIRKDGRAYLIDPELLEFQTSASHKQTVVLAELNEMLQNVKVNLVNRGLWKD